MCRCQWNQGLFAVPWQAHGGPRTATRHRVPQLTASPDFCINHLIPPVWTRAPPMAQSSVFKHAVARLHRINITACRLEQLWLLHQSLCTLHQGFRGDALLRCKHPRPTCSLVDRDQSLRVPHVPCMRHLSHPFLPCWPVTLWLSNTATTAGSAPHLLT